jgi:glycosyltransferase involved in cell wall biosynthesis
MIPVIGLDARMVQPTPSGLGTYATQLVRAIVARDTRHSYIVIRTPDSPGPIVAGPNVRDVVVPSPLDTPGNLLRGRQLSNLGIDLYHSLHHFLPPSLRVPRVVLTLHDLIWIEHRRLIVDGRFGAINRAVTHLYARGAMRYALRRANRVVAVSAYSALRAIERYGLDPSGVHIVHHGVDRSVFAPRAASSGESQPPYFVVLGNTRPYKNVPTALRAFAICARAHGDVRLVVAGRGDSFSTLQPLARALQIADRVRFSGPVSQRELVALLHGAVSLVFPSFIEGFGLPVVEAMAAGCPVIASSCPAIVEIAGDAAIFCDAVDANAFAAAMTMLLRDTQRRQDLRASGLARAEMFSWTDAADRTIAIYRALIGGG